MGNETETLTGLKYSRRSDVGRFDEEGNYQCVRCGFKHTVRECAEYRLAHANRELEKVTKFLHTPLGQEIGVAHSGESPVDTLLRGIKQFKEKEVHTELTEMMDKDEATMKGKE